MNGEIVFTLFPSVRALRMKAERLPLEAFWRHIEAPHEYQTKPALPLLKLGRFGDARSPAGSLRHDANLLGITGLEGDYDAGQMTLEQAAERLSFAGVLGMLYTSPSHTEQAPRWRVLCPLSQEHTPTQRRPLVARLNGVLGGVLAPESFALSQAYYVGKVNGSPYESRRIEGQFIDLLDELDSQAIDNGPREGQSRSERAHQARDNDPVVQRLRERGMVERSRPDGALDIHCPFASEHTAMGGASATTYFPPHTGGFERGHFHCMHSHCSGRNDAEFREAIGLGESAKTANESEQRKWPDALEPAAFYGIAGEIVRAIAPHTEADQAAVLLQLLSAAGSLIGRGPHYLVEGDQHHALIDVVLVGETSKGRKGTSLGRVRQVCRPVDAAWDTTRVVSGLASGEGLIWQVRDSIVKQTKNKKTGFIEDEIVDQGITDKRLLVVESEFARLLRVCGRDGNTLSAIIRDSWDRGDLRALAKNSPAIATGAHISIIGHITADELRLELTQTDVANGLANRFLFACVRRAQCLAFGGRLEDGELESLCAKLQKVIDSARHTSIVVMDEKARQIWESVYPVLSEGKPGLYGAATGRAEAQTVRLALIYALLDGAPKISAPHLLAAIAVWEYCAASASYIFGDSLGDPVADEILRALRAATQGLARTQLHYLFTKNQSAERIAAALNLLVSRKLAYSEPRNTGGRPSEIWKACVTN